MISITKYLQATNVQTGASYHTARKSTDLCQKGLEASANFINADADDVGRIMNGFQRSVRLTGNPQ